MSGCDTRVGIVRGSRVTALCEPGARLSETETGPRTPGAAGAAGAAGRARSARIYGGSCDCA